MFSPTFRHGPHPPMGWAEGLVSDLGGAGGRGRTGKGFRPTDFRTTSAFAAALRAFVVWTIPSS